LLGEVFTVIADTCQLVALNVVERIGEGHVAVGIMMTIGLAVGGDVNQLCPRAVVIEAAEQAVGKVLSVGEQFFERDRLRDGTVVKKQTDAAAGRKVACIGARGIDASSLEVELFLPGLVANPTGLVLGQNGELEADRTEVFECLQIDCRFRQPHALRVSSETVLEIAHAPDDLRSFIARVCQREDHVVVRLR